MSIHKSVLLNEIVSGLNLKPGSTVLDGTLGGGGHAKEVLEQVKGVKVLALDMDDGAIKEAKKELKKFSNQISFINANFRNLDQVLKSEGVAELDGIILDLGISSDQLEMVGRGFSFQKDEPLLMTMKDSPEDADLTAHDIVNTWSEQSLADIIYGYGEERYAKRIARVIVEERKRQEIKTTFDLVQVIEKAVPASYKRGRIHCATKTFQALRIAVNDELGALEQGLKKGFQALKLGGRMAVITFHSLEDRLVKRFYKELSKEGLAILINKKPIVASGEEIKNNNRSRSAKLRILEKK